MCPAILVPTSRRIDTFLYLPSIFLEMWVDYRPHSRIEAVRLSPHVERTLQQKKIDSSWHDVTHETNVVSSLTSVFSSWLRWAFVAIHYVTADSTRSREHVVLFLSYNNISSLSVTGSRQPKESVLFERIVKRGMRCLVQLNVSIFTPCCKCGEGVMMDRSCSWNVNARSDTVLWCWNLEFLAVLAALTQRWVYYFEVGCEGVRDLCQIHWLYLMHDI
jgi:hypothetical protein